MEYIKKLAYRICVVIMSGLIWIYKIIQRKRLRNDNFTILCSNCIGGIIYKRLGKKFLSPTINLWMNQKDFLKFALNLRAYTEKKLEFVDSLYDYPVAKLDDITIYFNHSKCEDDAANDWYRRVTRINYQNVYIIMYDRDGLTETDLLKVRSINCKNMIVLSDREHSDITYVKTIKPTKRINGQQFLDKNLIGFYTFEKHFDFVKWLNTEI